MAAGRLVPLDLRRVVKHGVQKRMMDLDLAIIADETELAEFVHEEADAGTGGADHLRQYFLADLNLDRPRAAFLAEVRQQQQKPRQPFLARIEQLIDQVGFNAAVGVSRYVMKSSENPGSLRRAASIAVFVMAVITQSSSAVVVEIRRGLPFRQLSPKNCPDSRIPTIASLPCSDSTTTLILPFRM